MSKPTSKAPQREAVLGDLVPACGPWRLRFRVVALSICDFYVDEVPGGFQVSAVVRGGETGCVINLRPIARRGEADILRRRLEKLQRARWN